VPACCLFPRQTVEYATAKGTAVTTVPNGALGEGNPLAGLKLIDSDTHFSEPYDLWTSRAPAKFKSRVPYVDHGRDGKLHWRLGDLDMSFAGGSSFVNRQGNKIPYYERDITSFEGWGAIHEASYDGRARVKFMDDIGVYAQIVYPNTLGTSLGFLLETEDKEAALATVKIYNDAVAEFAADGPGRIFPMAVMPLWDIDACAQEAARARNELGLRGVVMAGEPQLGGLPDLGQPVWDRFYEVVSELKMPINIHIAASTQAAQVQNWTQTAWPSLSPRAHKPVNSVQMELANSRFVSNLVLSDLAFRWPEVKWVSVESGIGWLPYVLERVDYEFLEDFPDDPAPDRPTAREMFQKNCYATFWFEDSGPRRLLDIIGPDNVMWETDFPHPTCLHPDAVRRSAETLREVGPENLRKIVQDNAAKLYGIDLGI
jgi:predicted TIM-barrel fold metal-dependent hydrolase